MQEHKLEKIKIADLKFDPSNPNEMDERQMKALKESMNKFGYLVPIIIDQKGKIADGEHRAKVYKQLGLKEIPGYRINLKNDTERRMVRQTMNKLRGEHNLEKDIAEVKLLANYDIGTLSKLIAQDQESLRYIIQQQDEADNDYPIHQLPEETGKESEEDKPLEIESTNTKCPKCGFEW